MTRCLSSRVINGGLWRTRVRKNGIFLDLKPTNHQPTYLSWSKTAAKYTLNGKKNYDRQHSQYRPKKSDRLCAMLQSNCAIQNNQNRLLHCETARVSSCTRRPLHWNHFRLISTVFFRIVHVLPFSLMADNKPDIYKNMRVCELQAVFIRRIPIVCFLG